MVGRSFRRALRRTLSLWGFGAAAGLLSLPPRAWASEPEAVSGGDPDPDPELAGELCPALTEGTLLAPEESCDLPAEAASASPEPALLTVLGSDVRLDGLPDLSGLSEQQAGLILSQVPESTAAGGGFFGTSGTGLAIGAGVVGGGAILVLASGGSDNGDNGGNGGNGDAMPSSPSPNVAPVTTTAAPATLTATEGEAAMWTVSAWFSDADTGDTLTYTAMGLPSWLVFDAAMAALTIAAGATDDAQVGSYTLAVTASDGDDETAVHTLTLTVANVNETPTTTTDAPATVTATEGEAASWTLTNWFRDPDTGDPLTYAVSGLPDGDWLELDDTMGELTIAANATDDAEVGRHTFTLTAADGDGESVVLVVTLAVANVNEAPALTAAAPTADAPLTVDEGEAMTWDIAAWFRDPDAGDTLTYTVSGNPDWLVFDAAMGELTIAEGATDDAQVGSYTLAVTASDGDDETAVHTLTLTVANVNEAPVVTLASAMLTAMEGEAATWTLTNWFRDPDAGDTLTYAVSGNPAWLTLDEATEALTIAAGETNDAQVGSYTLALTATDAGGETALAATHTLTLAVENTNDAPAVVTEGDSAAPATVTATEGLAFSEAVSGWFTDEDAGDTLTYAAAVLRGSGESQTAAVLPDWLKLDGATGALTIAAGATDDAQVGTYELAVTASDASAATALHTATLAIENVPESPTTTTAAPAMLPAREGLATDWNAATWFDDPDLAVPGGIDSLTYTGTLQKRFAAKSTPLAEVDWLDLDETTGALTIARGATDDPEVGFYTLVVTATDTTTPTQTSTTAMHVATLTIIDTVNEPSLSAAMSAVLSGRIAPAMGDSLVLDLTGVFTDLREDGSETPAEELSFEVSGSIDDTADENIITAVLDGTMLTLTPGKGGGPRGKIWEQETITITALDTEGGRGTAEFTVTTRANILKVAFLAPAHGFIILGDAGGELFTNVGDRLGWSVSGAGDVNSDGYDDLIVGAPEGDDGGENAGEAYIIYGKDNPHPDIGPEGTQFGTTEPMGVMRQVVDTTSLLPRDGLILQGDRAGDELGRSVSGAGDINGDGHDDFIVGANKGDDGGFWSGEAYIVYGMASNRIPGHQFVGSEPVRTGAGDDSVQRRVLDTTDHTPPPATMFRGPLKPAAAGFIIQGDAAGDELGWSVSGAGDINGDGYDDLITGAWKGGDGGSSAGEAYIIYGKANPADEEDAGTQFGMAVRLAADGTTTLMLEDGDPIPPTSVLRQVLDITKLSPMDGFILQGDMGGDISGYSVSGAGDVNGDGVGDLIVGAPAGDDGGNGAGEAYIIYGKAGTDGSQFGKAVALSVSVDMPDMNPENNVTMTITTTLEKGESAPADSVVRRVLDTTNLAPTDGFILQGDEDFENLGNSVSGAGDVNGDGFDDLIVGAWKGNDGGRFTGEAYIVYGKANPADVSAAGTQFGTMVGDRQVLDMMNLAPAAGFIIQGVLDSGTLGISVAGAGDINGDGLDDLIAGAHDQEPPSGGFVNAGPIRPGEAYIIYGKTGNGTQFGTEVESRQVLDIAGGLAPTDGFILQGKVHADILGGSVSGAGDINGDGYDDLIVGAREGDDGGFNAGEAYVVYGGTHLGEVTTHAQTLEGAAGELFLLGGAGDDVLEGHADTEVLYGGAGDDVLMLEDDSFRRVDGGSGVDTLVLGAGVTLDLTDATVRGLIRSIEVVSLSDATAEVTVDQAAVYGLVDSYGGWESDRRGVGGKVLLRLEGDSGMVEQADKGSWKEASTLTLTDGEVNENSVFRHDGSSAYLLIDDGLDVA